MIQTRCDLDHMPLIHWILGVWLHVQRFLMRIFQVIVVHLKCAMLAWTEISNAVVGVGVTVRLVDDAESAVAVETQTDQNSDWG